MRAVVIRDTQLHWEERDDPVPGDTELLVAVRAAGLNGADMMQRQGLYPAPPGAPADIPGMELAGEVVAVGAQVTRFPPGDRGHVPGGRRWPGHHGRGRGVPRPGRARLARLAEAGGFPEVFSTAFDALFTQRRSAHGRAGPGLGRRRWGRHGRRPVGGCHRCLGRGRPCATPARREEVGPSAPRPSSTPARWPRHGPYDVVLELVGAASLPTVLPHLATGARVMVIGVGSGAKIELNLLQLMGARARIGGATLRGRTRREKADVAAAVAAHVLPLARLGPPPGAGLRHLSAGRGRAAYDRFAAGGKLGKVVLVS